jgi:deoxyribonuclease-4
MGNGVEIGIKRIAASLDATHEATRGFKCRVLLETTAGQGTTVGHAVEHLGEIIDRTKAPDRVGVCLDTCHLFAAGYDLRDETSYEIMIGAMKKSFGLDRIACIHTNDSKGDLAGRIDRHEHIGKGRIGRRGFARIMNDNRLAQVPRILETPKGTDGRGANYDKLNMNKLRRMVAK